MYDKRIDMYFYTSKLIAFLNKPINIPTPRTVTETLKNIPFHFCTKCVF